MADGLTLVIGLILGLAVASQSAASVWHAALGGGLAEFGGMALGQYWSDEGRDKVAAALNGAACAVATIATGAPFAITHGLPAVLAAMVIAVVLAGVVSWLREETGVQAIARTFGLLVIAGLLSAASGLI